MAPNAFYDSLLRLPPTTAVLVISAIFGGNTHAHALPRQTKTVEYHELDVINWPPLPTEAPISPFELLRRQEENTICGFIGGNSGLPATCSAGSHCVLEQGHGVIGCCPNGGTCTTGIFTGCVDFNSGAQTEANPYVFTCQGSDVCYKNSFAGGFFQFGCGTASNLATTVQTSAGTNAVDIPVTSVQWTGSVTSLATPTSIDASTGTRSTTSSSSSNSFTTSSTSSATSSSSTSSTVSSGTASGSPTSSGSAATAAPATTGSSFDRNGAIIGGTIAGAAILMALAAIIVYCLGKRTRRRGPGPAPGPTPTTTAYMSPTRSHGAAFAPLRTWQEEEEEPPTPQPIFNRPYNPNGVLAGPPYTNADPKHSIYDPAHEPAGEAVSPETPRHPATGQPLGWGPKQQAREAGRPVVTPIADAHMNRQRELDDFSRGFNTAVGSIRDEDTHPLTVANPDDYSSSSDGGSPPRRIGSSSGSQHRPLWQQNRRQSRNLMWM